jgi:hypothetical protein
MRAASRSDPHPGCWHPGQTSFNGDRRGEWRSPTVVSSHDPFAAGGAVYGVSLSAYFDVGCSESAE